MCKGRVGERRGRGGRRGGGLAPLCVSGLTAFLKPSSGARVPLSKLEEVKELERVFHSASVPLPPAAAAAASLKETCAGYLSLCISLCPTRTQRNSHHEGHRVSDCRKHREGEREELLS